MTQRGGSSTARISLGQPAEVYLSCSDDSADKALRAELETHLAPLVALGLVRVWHRDKIAAGAAKRRSVAEHLDSARFVLLLVSAEYLASDDCKLEVDRAMARRGPTAPVIVPVPLRPSLWEDAVFCDLKPLPSHVPVTKWPSRDDAWSEVVRGLRSLLERHDKKSSRPPPPSSGDDSGGRAPTLRPTYVDRVTRELSEQLEGAYERKGRLEEVGQDVAVVTREILDLKRQLRAAGHLKAGDLLGNGRYLLMSQLGKGGFALIWRARDRSLNQDVAIKVLRPDLAADPIRRGRFLRGARVMSKLRHASIVRVLDVPPHDIGWHYYVMELLTGGDLREAVLAKRIGHDQVLSVMLEVSSALAEVHAARWVHRDVKPANIVLTEGGVPKITDFDLVGGPETTGGTTGPIGSPIYAAPELITRPQETDARADVYSLGMTTLFALYGEDWPDDILLREHAQTLIERLRCSDAVKEVLARAVDFDAEKRFKDAAAYREALARAIEAKISELPAPPSDRFHEVTAPHRIPIGLIRGSERPPAGLIDTSAARTERINIEAPPLRDAPLIRISDAYLATIHAPPGAPTGPKLTFTKNPTIIGRDPAPDGGGIVLSHNSISRVHAHIELRGFSLVIIDAGSTNGTFVAHRPRWTDRDKVFGVTLLQYGDYISFGREYTFQVELRQQVGGEQHMREFERLKVDAPTGLPSRRYLDWCLEREALRAQQQRQSLSFLVLRLLKRPGQVARTIDGQLVELAQIVRKQTADGLVGRFGQRAVGALLKGKTAEHALALGASVRRQAPPSMSVRVGAAEILAGDRDPGEALRNRVSASIEIPPDEDGDDFLI